MPDSADPLPTQPSPDPDMPPRKPLAGGGGKKLKKPLTDKQRAAAEQRLSHLRAHLNLRPLESPAAGARALPPLQEAALDALGLLDFFRLDLQSDAPRPDLIAPLVAYYDPACKRSFVRGVRVAVSRHDLTRALSLPPKPASAAPAPADVDPAAVVPAVMQLLQDYVLLPFQGDDMCILPQEVAAAEQAVREGAAHRVDWGGLIWGLVEKEMLELPKREDGLCYYGPHLQRLIYAQKPHLLSLVEEGPVPEVSADVEMEEDDGDVDLKSKSLVELEPGDGDGDGDGDAGNDVRSKSLEESELGNAGGRNDGLDELQLGDAVTRNKVMEELCLGDVDARNNSIEELEVVEEYARIKSLNECEAVDVDPDAMDNNIHEWETVNEDARSKSLNESEAVHVDPDAMDNNIDEMETVNEDARTKSLDESEAVDVNPDAMDNNIDEMDAVNEDARSKSMNESEAVDAINNNIVKLDAVNEDARSKSLNDESEPVEEDVKGPSFDDMNTVDEHVNGTNTDGLCLGFVAVEAVSAVHEARLDNNEERTEEAPAGGDDVAVPTDVDGEEPSVEAVVVTQEVVAVADELGDEEAEGDEERDAMGLSLGFNSTNGYGAMDVEEETNVENLDEDESDSGNEEAEESEDDAFDVNDGEDMNWRIGDGQGDEGMAHSLQRCNTFGGMEFEDLNKGEAEMRDELRFDDFPARASLERMTSSNLLQAMNSIPSSYNVAENVHDLPSGDFLAMGADAHKSGVDLGPGSSYLFGNNGKRNIDDIDGYNGNMQVQEEFPQSNQHKRMRHSNSSNISPGSAFFNASFSVPIQNLMVEASRLYEKNEQKLQNLQFEKQQWSHMLQQKEAIIQSLNSARFEQQNKYQAELRHFEHDLNVMAQLVTTYKKALKQTRASFDEYRKKFPCNVPLYGDVAGSGGLVLGVRELEKRRCEEEQQNIAMVNGMIERFQYEWFSKQDEWGLSVNSLWSRVERLYKEIQLLKENRRARFATPATEESIPATEE
ncbi:midasin-like [Miscanthus floridulus]|uniref:midasin-like n=1 Tax=Miscanthus floridulus TaxID=154761 RepID=UPI00345B34CD